MHMIWLQASLSFVLGACIGSFINAAEYRLARQEKVVKDRSRCRACRTPIAWYDLVPILSYFILRGRCRSCRDSISWQYPLVEFVTGLLYASLLFLHPVLTTPADLLLLLRDLVAVSVAVFLFVYDYKYQLLPDLVTIPTVVICAILALLLGMPVFSLALGMAVGGGFFLVQYLLSRGAWVGGGDIRYGLFLGAVFGWPLVLVSLFLAYVIGAVFAIVLLAMKRKKPGQTIAFGTFLSLGLVLTLWWGDRLLAWYLNFL